jgi:mitochondrial pyruvate carrier 1
MTAALCLYSSTFMRYSMAVTPKNYLLFGCHFVNLGAQLTQGYRYVNHNHWGGKEKLGVQDGVAAVKDKVQVAEDKARDALGK